MDDLWTLKALTLDFFRVRHDSQVFNPMWGNMEKPSMHHKQSSSNLATKVTKVHVLIVLIDFLMLIYCSYAFFHLINSL